MSQAGVVSWLAIRELWMSFRLFVLLLAFVLAGTSVTMFPAGLSVLMPRLALTLGIATAVTAGAAAWTIATERRRGRTGWLVARAVPRGTVLSGWFVAFAVVTLASLGTALLLGWVAATGVAATPDLAGYLLVALDALAGVMAAVAIGVAAGSLLAPPIAAVAGAAGTALLGLLAWSAVVPVALVPVGGAIALVGQFREAGVATGPVLIAAGVSLAATAVFMGAARVALERSEL